MRLKRWVKSFIFTFIITLVVCLISYKFDLFNYILDYFKVNNNIDIKEEYTYEPNINIIDVNSNSRPYMVAINNNKDSWPHFGLNKAYLCYELIAEGGITRILALYKDIDLDKIGSVRSARHYFIDYVLENDAIFVHYGHSPKALEDLNNLKIDNLNGMYTINAFYRDNSLNKAYEHTAFTSTDLIKQYSSKYNYRLTSNEQLLKYKKYVNMDKYESINATNISIEYSSYTTTKYVYDSETKTYKQYMKDTLQVDGKTNEEYTVKNIIVYQVKNESIDSSDRQELYNIGSGEGYYISNGKAVKISWNKKDRASKTEYTFLNGDKLIVNDGNTWIHISPSNKSVVIE